MKFICTHAHKCTSLRCSHIKPHDKANTCKSFLCATVEDPNTVHVGECIKDDTLPEELFEI